MVKRYGISYRTPDATRDARMIAKDHGDYVRFEDYAALESENTRLQAELSGLKDQIEDAAQKRRFNDTRD